MKLLLKSSALILGIVSECGWCVGRAMYEVGLNQILLPERDLPVVDEKKMAADVNEASRVIGAYQRTGNDALKAACGGTKGWVLK